MPWHSRLGCDLLYRLEASWLLSDVYTQTAAIEVDKGNGKRYRYAAHALALAHDGRLVSIECVWSQSLQNAEHSSRHHAIAQQLRAQGVEFRLVTELQLDAPHVREASRALVQALRTPRPAAQDAQDLARLAQSRPETFGELRSLLGSPAAMRMLALGHAFFNTHERLGATTALSYTHQEHFDAAHIVLAA